MKQIRLVIAGRVQGVWFRASTRERATELGVSGWVRNLSDGTVEAVAEGRDGPVDELTAWCREGPPGAKVETVEVSDQPLVEGFSDFVIRY